MDLGRCTLLEWSSANYLLSGVLGQTAKWLPMVLRAVSQGIITKSLVQENSPAVDNRRWKKRAILRQENSV